MRPLPKVVFAGRLCRIRFDGGLEAALNQLPNTLGHTSLQQIEGTKWCCFWLSFDRALASGDKPHDDGVYHYPYLCRVADDRFIVASTDSSLVDIFFEQARIAGFVESPRVHVDRATRDLVFPPTVTEGHTPGRRYILGAVYGAVEGYARALRNVSFFGDDIAEAALFRYALEQISVTRLTIRDPNTDEGLISLNTTGGLDFHFRGVKHLNSIDALTAFFKAHGYIEWRTGRTWQSQ